MENGEPAASANTPDPTPSPTACPTATPGTTRAVTSSLDRPSQANDFSDYPADNEQVLLNTSLEIATNLFPQDLSDAIKRLPDPGDEQNLTAAISMAFPKTQYADRIGCQMTIEITENKVEWIAWELFNVRLETMEGLRYKREPGGTLVLPSVNFIIRGCLLKAIFPIFGVEVGRGVQASPMSQDNVRSRLHRCHAVSMVVPHQSRDGAKLDLYLGLLEGANIRKKLCL